MAATYQLAWDRYLVEILTRLLLLQAHMAADWFHKLGFTLPYGTNVADFILDLASGAILNGER